MENHYETLGCTPKATFEDLKKSYQELVKKYHPDKNGGRHSEEFLKINRAWKILQENTSRKKFDAILFQDNFNEKYLVYAEVNLHELSFDNGRGYYPCRCGENYVIEEKMLKEYNFEREECILECSECSNCIIVKVDRIH